MDYEAMTDDQLAGALLVLDYLISITPCSGKTQENQVRKAIIDEQATRVKTKAHP